MTDYDEILEKLKTVKGEKLDGVPSVPTHWNHYKRQYGALITSTDEKFGFKREFVTRYVNYTSSGANADMELTVDLDELPEGSILETKDGSHKHMNVDVYRKDSDGWKAVAEREKSGAFGKGYDTGYKFLGDDE